MVAAKDVTLFSSVAIDVKKGVALVKIMFFILLAKKRLIETCNADM